MSPALRALIERLAKKAVQRHFAKIGLLPLDHLRALPVCAPSSSPVDRSGGLYFLWNGPLLVYIGKSDCAEHRISNHRRAHSRSSTGGFMAFTRATFLPVVPEARYQMEARYVRLYRPIYNRTIGRGQ